jgi:hypothetical protein
VGLKDSVLSLVLCNAVTSKAIEISSFSHVFIGIVHGKIDIVGRNTAKGHPGCSSEPVRKMVRPDPHSIVTDHRAAISSPGFPDPCRASCPSSVACLFSRMDQSRNGIEV